MAARERHRQRLLDLKAEILAEGDIDLEPGRLEATAVGSDEDAQPLTEMSQAIASSRNRNRSGVLARVVAALGRLEADPEMFGRCTECEQATDGPRRGGRRHLRDFR